MNTNDTWSDPLAGYFRAMNGANRSPGTIKLHRFYLAKLRDAHRDPWSVTLDDLSCMLSNPAWKGDAKKSARTVYRGFYKWAHGTGLIEHDPSLVLPVVSVPSGTPRPTPELLAKRVMRDPDGRIAFMAMLAGYCGLRAGEIALVHSDDWQDGRLRVHGKGRKTRTLRVFHVDLINLLDRMDGWAFPGRIDGHLAPGTVSRYLSDAIPGTWTGHTLRHRAATTAYAGCQDLLAVGQMLGHARMETTQRYVALADSALDAALRAAAA